MLLIHTWAYHLFLSRLPICRKISVIIMTTSTNRKFVKAEEKMAKEKKEKKDKDSHKKSSKKEKKSKHKKAKREKNDKKDKVSKKGSNKIDQLSEDDYFIKSEHFRVWCDLIHKV